MKKSKFKSLHSILPSIEVYRERSRSLDRTESDKEPSSSHRQRGTEQLKRLSSSFLRSFSPGPHCNDEENRKQVKEIPPIYDTSPIDDKSQSTVRSPRSGDFEILDPSEAKDDDDEDEEEDRDSDSNDLRSRDSSHLGSSKSAPVESPRVGSPSSGGLNQVDPAPFTTTACGSNRYLSLDHAVSIIGGESISMSRMSGGDQQEVTTTNKDSHKVFGFSLPLSNPLATLETPGLRRLFDTRRYTFSKPNPLAEDKEEDPTLRLEHISTNEERQLYGNIHSQDNSRLRAIMDTLTDNLSIVENINPLNKDKKESFPELDGDVVILGGYRGSILRDARTGRRVWIPIKVGLNIRKIDLTVGPNDDDEYRAQEKIIPSGLLSNIGPVDISKRLINRLKASGCRVHEFGYDWRLSCDISSEKLHQFLKNLPCNRDSHKKKGAIVIAHSMGGLIAHHAMQKDPELFRGIVYAGTPSKCPNILGPLRHGDSVLLSTRVLTAKINFLMRSSFIFLPTDGRCFIDRNDPSKRYDMDFYDAKTWVEYNLSPCVSKDPAIRALQNGSLDFPSDIRLPKWASPNGQLREELPFDVAVNYLDRTLKRAKKFHEELEYKAELKDRYPPMVVICGYSVPTLHSAKVSGPEEIKAGNFNDLSFGPGDGVVYFKSLMPEAKGFEIEEKILTQKGHVSLLSDLTAMGRALSALLKAEKRREQERAAKKLPVDNRVDSQYLEPTLVSS